MVGSDTGATEWFTGTPADVASEAVRSYSSGHARVLPSQEEGQDDNRLRVTFTSSNSALG